jgi:hypothetical protein
MYTVGDVPGKGKGLIATEDIPLGTRIISEKPFVTSGLDIANLEQLQVHLYQQISSLGESQQQAFLSLHNIYPYTNLAARYRGIFRTNALPTGPNLDIGGIFLIACRINHACDNNAQNFWNDNIDQLTIHAIKDIPKGEEITISYLGSRRGRGLRQEELRRNFKFTCSCALCSLAPDQSRESDSRLNRVHELDCIIAQGGIQGLVAPAQRMLSYVDEQVQIWNESTPDIIGLVRAYPDAFQICIANGDLARASVFAERCLSLYLITGGDDSPEIPEYRELVQDPKLHQYYGMSMKWKTTLDEVPQELGTEEFEDWLWRRTTEGTQGQLASLRDRETFPSYDDLPDEHDLARRYLNNKNLGHCHSVPHWCFLAEIKDINYFARLHMTVEDVEGSLVPVAFHTSRRGGELSESQTQIGYTIAILYALRHAFMFSEPGIRHEDPQMIKVRDLGYCDAIYPKLLMISLQIFPLPLNRLQNLSENFEEFSTDLDGISTCHSCGKKGASLKRCAKCLTFWYCNKVRHVFIELGSLLPV